MGGDLLRERLATICELAATVDSGAGDLTEPADLAQLLADIRDAKKNLAALYDRVEQLLVSVMGEKELHVDGLGVVVCRRDKSYKDWNHEALLRDVLDSKLVTGDGEIVEETPLEKVQQVWPLAGYQARRGAIKARGLNADDYSNAEARGWKIQLPSGDEW